MASRNLKAKLNSVKNIGQITKAMELVAATKMRKAQEVALRARPYAKYALSLLRSLLLLEGGEELRAQSHFFNPSTRPERSRGARSGQERVCLVVVTSDRGLCGGFNSQVLRAALRFREQYPDSCVVAIGKKGKEFFERRGIPVLKSFSDFSEIVTLADVAPVAEFLLEEYGQHRHDTIAFCSTQFVSALFQKVELYRVLPVTLGELEKTIQGIVPKSGKYSDVQNGKERPEPVVSLLEPGAKALFEGLAEDLVRVEILHLIFESNASEHSSRMLAMKNATDNAEDLQEELQLLLNKARQGAITQELSEIASAKEALSV
ncbi:MAG: ATP synthase F1 subunit gamma [Candidatus Wildermuthbacteria bacterium]|nr:ATP synthase F1 subunit gamma [Candidatus Wildermuthbacteria bacterium]